ncbi:GNAT family N-acetyltransferase [Endozoicomonas ascidiicola]|uniref:GNAT family N-acetyltransferase n=1 Tax=Endozoicomonas ascidiicola TaxID=1698521 RepID=UPI000830AB6C|nr:GNAT family protein [Endozoicomonas ascidiicola]
MHIDLGNGYCLRRFLYGDAIALANHGNNPKISQYLRDTFPNPYTIEHARAWVQHVKEHETKTRFAIDYNGEAIGEIGFVVQLDVHRFGAEIGFWVSEDHWGKGIMTKALSYVTNYAFDEMGLVRIYADVQARNPGSRKVLEKCGFELEGVMKKHVYKDDQFIDQLVFALVR